MYFLGLLALLLILLLFGNVTQPIFGQSPVGNTSSTVPKVASVPQVHPSAARDTTVPNIRVIDPTGALL